MHCTCKKGHQCIVYLGTQSGMNETGRWCACGGCFGHFEAGERDGSNWGRASGASEAALALLATASWAPQLRTLQQVCTGGPPGTLGVCFRTASDTIQK